LSAADAVFSALSAKVSVPSAPILAKRRLASGASSSCILIYLL
jgi:hypothetical protein